jgi:DNA repair exonuclease SbcCD ATPase subunit
MKLRDAYRQKIEAQIEELDARLAVLRAQAKRMSADAKIAAYEELAETDKKLTALKARLKAMRTASDKAWQEMKGGVETAWSDLHQAAKRALKHLG